MARNACSSRDPSGVLLCQALPLLHAGAKLVWHKANHQLKQGTITIRVAETRASCSPPCSAPATCPAEVAHAKNKKSP